LRLTICLREKKKKHGKRQTTDVPFHPDAPYSE
jgi:hypothetical protein